VGGVLDPNLDSSFELGQNCWNLDAVQLRTCEKKLWALGAHLPFHFHAWHIQLSCQIWEMWLECMEHSNCLCEKMDPMLKDKMYWSAHRQDIQMYVKRETCEKYKLKRAPKAHMTWEVCICFVTLLRLFSKCTQILLPEKAGQSHDRVWRWDAGMYVFGHEAECATIEHGACNNNVQWWLSI